MKLPLVEQIASSLSARDHCIDRDNGGMVRLHTKALAELERELPNGSGFDEGTKISLDKSRPERLVLHTHFHHMNDNGMYDGWTEHTVVVKPSLVYGIKLTISGPNRNGVKQYIEDVFQTTLRSEVEQPPP